MTDTFSEHRNVVQNLERIISSFIKNKSCVVLSVTEFKWDGVPYVYKPDVSLLCGPRRKDGTYYSDVPRFIAEVLFDSTEQDERCKRWRLGAVCKVMVKYENAAKEEGREEGAAHKVFEWVEKGKFTISEGAEDLHLSIAEFLKRMKNAGFKLPQT